MNDDEDADILGSLMSGVQLAAGWALPIDVGVNFNLPVGFRVSAVARDINGKYTMQNYPEMGMWVNDLYEFIGLEPEYVATTSDESVELIN